jgi:small subunit ribosomal protein S9
LTETPENDEPTREEDAAGAPDAESAGADAPTGEGDEQSARADSSSDAPTAESEEPAASEAEEPVTEDPIVEQPAQEAAEPESAQAPPEPESAEAPPEPEATEAQPEPGSAEAQPEPESAEAQPEPEAAAPAEPAEQPEPAAQAEPESSADEEIELAPRQKPEIPGADLDVLLPEEEQYLDAEAQAAAEAEAEAAAERARAEAEDEQSKPIADAAIDLAAGARYTATGKRKTAVARVILKPGTGEYVINGKSLEAFFPRDTLQRMIRQPLETVGYEARMDVVARMHGGGVAAQAGALRHGISRALIEADPNLRGELKRRGYLTRDPRVKERKKAGLKKARKRPQFSKR